jgi:sensor histidine kinase regulating citrate/malate metabolism
VRGELAGYNNTAVPGNSFYAATRQARNGADPEFAPMLRVTIHDHGEAVEIRVRDNGTGIPADIGYKLFQPFFTTKPIGEGTDLDLSESVARTVQRPHRQSEARYFGPGKAL